MTKPSYEAELEYLDSLAQFSPAKVVSGQYELGLEAIKELLSLTGDPQDKLRIIHVAGTNGKGSTIAFLSEILINAGYRVGVYTSPALLRITDQIRINDVEISEEDFSNVISRLRPYIEKMSESGHKITTQFETVTVAALMYFLEKSCDVVILECGLGGKTDATNIIPTPILSVITSIGLDHTEILGDTLEKIAEQKAGIIKSNGTAIVQYAKDSVLDVFRNRCASVNAKLIAVPEESSELSESMLGLKGKYQIKNALLAKTCAKELIKSGFSISDSSVAAGLKNAKWTCRFEIINKRPMIIIDGGHNTDGISALKDSLVSMFPDKKIRFIVGVLKDKAYKDMMDIIIPIAEKIYTVTVPSKRALSAKELSGYFNEKGIVSVPFETIDDAVENALSESSDDDIVCAFGSLYYVGLARKKFINLLNPQYSKDDTYL